MDCVCTNCPIKLRLRRRDKDIPSVSYFRFPNNRILLRKWLLFCGKKRDYNYSLKKICSIHFKSEDLIENIAYKLGFSSVKNHLRPGAVPCIATEEDIEREKERVENLKIIYRKKLIDDIINNEIAGTLHERTMPVISKIVDPVRDPIATDNLADLSPQQGSDSIKTVPASFSRSNQDIQQLSEKEKMSLSRLESLDNTIDSEENFSEEFCDERGLQKEINILLKRYKVIGATDKLRMILELKSEFDTLKEQSISLRKKEIQHNQIIADLNQQIADDKLHLNILKDQLEKNVPFEGRNHIKSYPRRVWTRFEIETSLEEFLNNGRVYSDRCKKECIPSVRTLQKWRREQYPMKKRPKYKLICEEDTIERGVKNLGFEIETYKPPELEKLLPNVYEIKNFIFPEENQERGVAELLDSKTLALNGIVIYDNYMIMEKKKTEILNEIGKDYIFHN